MLSMMAYPLLRNGFSLKMLYILIRHMFRRGKGIKKLRAHYCLIIIGHSHLMGTHNKYEVIASVACIK